MGLIGGLLGGLRRDPSQPVQVGLPPREEGVSAFPVISLMHEPNGAVQQIQESLFGEGCRLRTAVGLLLAVGVTPTGCLRVALFVTERYLWSFRPLTSHFLPALCADRLLWARAIASSGGGGQRMQGPPEVGGT